MINIDKNNMLFNKYLHFTLNKYKLNKYLNTDILDIIYESIILMIEYINENISQLIYEDLFEPTFEYTYDILYGQYINDNILENICNLSQKNCINILFKCVLVARSFVFKFVIPKRSYQKSYIRKNLENKSYNLTNNYNKIASTIEKLKSIKQPEQRSDEWYIFRNSTLTASNIWKIFFSDYSQTQLILEKCEPLNINKFKNTNLNSPLHWGQKYEPISCLYYEYINNTTVTEFGCIPHSKYGYIAASPDGIVCDNNSELYGRMLEIKNVVSREITGIPKMEYWIQMQLQMEVCNLNECDFLETKFVEYLTEEDYLSDTDTEYKGIILQYLKDDAPYYIYAPIMLNDINSNEYKDWLSMEMDKHIDLELIKTIYWKLEKISCVLVLRNKEWFNTILPSIETFWDNLVYERDTGKYKERIRQKRKLEIADVKSKSDFPNSGCLINTDKFTENIIITESKFNIDTEPYS